MRLPLLLGAVVLGIGNVVHAQVSRAPRPQGHPHLRARALRDSLPERQGVWVGGTIGYALVDGGTYVPFSVGVMGQVGPSVAVGAGYGSVAAWDEGSIHSFGAFARFYLTAPRPWELFCEVGASYARTRLEADGVYSSSSTRDPVESVGLAVAPGVSYTFGDARFSFGAVGFGVSEVIGSDYGEERGIAHQLTFTPSIGFEFDLLSTPAHAHPR